ncbi:MULTISPECIES: carboxy terminal-processing peptidase [unclassified Pseudoalteromonas]|jgi:carboxyl-terminal processing protease|uniref:carboxy terminal-processing peptidase n=1 Tax=unclassified Pseudoalteromonas TaxID=194690 RepID=UPI000B6CB562|nr:MULTISPECIES: carboxy terminal-processing peptidase [unclassified Pseudoalteromonas]MAJ39944.1 carboxy terminal-processing peptidase [Pseudoalteromonadaceae bacterium]MCP4058662.1 carboxy terminal-processing peptidase [Pseudoalteromonas sp.]MDC9520779.1 carboxy terminal-processing peptidase [Pseudoalteromonas sp. Angola-31]OUX89401.1 MAG: tail-specific peptidase [Pseudoalteromonas sp. TMED43]MCK8094129.1 carboxy terminal-processing peptidase [Pseudoalteromonas sp. 1CM17D]|tara:strand:+ start:1821 stop:3845 length:2025 start_codon:yes stop_codon:yes gene_type:complete
MSKKFTLIPLVAALFSGSLFASVEAAKLEDLPVLKQESQHGTASKRVANLFARSHYTPVRFNDGLSSKVYDRYIESLDFNKSVFLASDIAAFEKYRNDFDNAITTGKLGFTFDIFNLSLKRRFERYDYSLSLLDKEMTFDKDDEYFFDREDSAWPASQAELDEIWRERVKYDALRLKMTGKDWEGIKEVLTKRYKNAQKRLVQTNSEDAFQIVMNSLARSIEAHTSYLSPRRAEQFKMDMDLELEGIGAVLSPDEDYTVIRSLVPGGPADKTEQLKADDKIIGVAQDQKEFVDVIGWRLDDVVDLIKGPKGTKVRLQYLKGSDAHGTPKVVEITRDKIRLEDRAAKSEVFEASYSNLTSKIGVIEIPGFYNNLSKDVKVELAKLKEENVDGIIIDLRQNGGGSLYEATQLSGLFFDQGPVVQIHTLNNRIEEQKDRDGITYYDGPLTVLVDRYSASASEIFAAAMQDYGRAVIIGEQTFGKGTVQQHKGLGRAYDLYDNDLGSVQYTIAKFYRINGGSTQHKGVIPDISFPSAIDPAEWGESKQDNALPWDSIVRAKYNRQGNLTPVITYLEKQHEVRIKSEPEFGYVFDDIARYNEEKDRKTISLVEADRIKEKDENEARTLARTNERLKRLGKEPIENLDDVPEVIEELDPFLEEAALITQDYINFGRIAKK